MKAYHSVNQCILTAKQQADSAVTFASSGQIFVESSSESGTRHSATVTEETASCSCRAVNICSHIIKVLMLKGASEKCLLQHLGIHWGRSTGGFAPVMQAIKARAHETSALAPEVASGSLQNDPAVAAEPEQHESIVQTLPLHASADVASRRGTRLQTEQAKAFAALDELRALGASWESGSENWTIFRYHVLAAANAVEKATGKPAQHCDPTAQLHTNPDAPEGNSTQRLLSFVDGGPSRGGGKRQPKQPVKGAFPADHSGAVIPFVLSKKAAPKARSVLQEIQAKFHRSSAVCQQLPLAHRQLRICSLILDMPARSQRKDRPPRSWLR